MGTKNHGKTRFVEPKKAMFVFGKGILRTDSGNSKAKSMASSKNKNLTSFFRTQSLRDVPGGTGGCFHLKSKRFVG